MRVRVHVIVYSLIVFTETACHNVGQAIAAKYGKQLTKEVVAKALGKRALESWDIIRQELDIPATAQELLDLSEPELLQRYAPDARHDCCMCPSVQVLQL